MVNFYTATGAQPGGAAALPQLERLLSNKQVALPGGGGLVHAKFNLEPVGLPRLPLAGEMRRYLKHILLALQRCQQAGWCVVDVRPSNVVLTTGDTWVLIDAAEHATLHGQPLPAGVAPAVPMPRTANAHTDIYQLAAMLQPLGAAPSPLLAYVTNDVFNAGPEFWAAMQRPVPETPTQLLLRKYMQGV